MNTDTIFEKQRAGVLELVENIHAATTPCDKAKAWMQLLRRHASIREDVSRNRPGYTELHVKLAQEFPVEYEQGGPGLKTYLETSYQKLLAEGRKGDQEALWQIVRLARWASRPTSNELFRYEAYPDELGYPLDLNQLARRRLRRRILKTQIGPERVAGYSLRCFLDPRRPPIH